MDSILDSLRSIIADSDFSENTEDLEDLRAALEARVSAAMGSDFAAKVHDAADELTALRCRAAFRDGCRAAGRLLLAMLS